LDSQPPGEHALSFPDLLGGHLNFVISSEDDQVDDDTISLSILFDHCFLPLSV